MSTTKAKLIKDFFIQYPNTPYKTMAKMFQTTPSYLKRVLKAEGLYVYRGDDFITQGQEFIDDAFISATAVDTVFDPIDYIPVTFDKRVVYFCDLHIPYVEEIALRAMLSAIVELKPDIIVLGGDIIDFYGISRFCRCPKAMPMHREVPLCIRFLTKLRERFPDTEIYFLLGNHERRLQSYLWSKAPELSGIEALDLANILKLDKLDIELIDNKEWMKTHGEFFKIGNLYYLHGDEPNRGKGGNTVNVARIMYDSCDEPIIYGHFHRMQEDEKPGIRRNAVNGSYSIPCMCKLHPDFATVNRWSHGFAVIDYDKDGNFIVSIKKIIKGKVY